VNDYRRTGRASNALLALAALGLFTDSIYSDRMGSMDLNTPLEPKRTPLELETMRMAQAKRDRKAAKKAKDSHK